MLKKLLMLLAALVLSLSAGFASAVEVNTADQAALESVKGIGPVHAKAIIDERTKNGPFKDADDLANRVKGIGQKSVKNLEAAGLTINGSSAPPMGAPAKSTAGTMSKSTPAPAPAATTAQTPAPAAPADAASGSKASKSKKKSKADAAASAPAATAASAPAMASDATASKSKKSKKSKAASAASGA